MSQWYLQCIFCTLYWNLVGATSRLPTTTSTQYISTSKQSFAYFLRRWNAYEDIQQIVHVKQLRVTLWRRCWPGDTTIAGSGTKEQSNEREERKRQFRLSSRTYVQVCVQPCCKRLSAVGDVAKCTVQLEPAVSMALLICRSLQINE